MQKSKLSINLFVSDLSRAFAFYEKAFAAVKIDAAHFKIADYDFAMAAAPENTPRARGGVGLCLQLWVSDLEVALSNLTEAGGTISTPGTAEVPIFITPDGQRVANVQDLDGHVWSLTQI